MRIMAIALTAALLACGNPPTPPPPAAPPVLSGTYTLQTVDGQPLPYRHRVETGREHYVSGGSIVFFGQNAATFTQLWRVRDVAPNPERWLDEFTGFTVPMTYSRNGNDVTVTVPFGVDPPSMSVSGDGATITLHFLIPPNNFRRYAFVFRRA